jgi:hypothetical protein
MIGNLAGLAVRLRRPRILALAAAIVLGAAFVPVLASAPSALALTCSYPTFYTFENYGEGGQIAYSPTDVVVPGELGDEATSALEFCQYQTPGNEGSQWYEWVAKGTSDCMTLFAAGVNSEGVPATYYIYLTTCEPSGVAIASQQWLVNPGNGTLESAWEDNIGWYLETFPRSPPAPLTYNAPSLGAPLNADDYWTLINEGS